MTLARPASATLMLTALGLAIGPGPAMGQTAAQREERLERVQSGLPAGQFEIRNGIKVDPSKYPAMLYFVRSQLCSGSLVAAQVLLTAKHCIADKMTINVPRRVGSNDRVTGRCDHLKADPGELDVDIALCLLDHPVEAEFERLNRDPNKPALNEKVHVAGFGCGDLDVSDVGEPVFRTGDTVVVAVPNHLRSYLTTKGGATLCMGDSGGATYIVTASGRLLQAAVNSDFASDDSANMASVSAPVASRLIRKWAAHHNQRICGLDPLAKGCRP